MKKSKSATPSEEYARFEKLAAQLISVPKSEIDKRQAQYEKSRGAAKKRKAAQLRNSTVQSTETLTVTLFRMP